MKRFKGVRGTIVLLILMCMLVGYYFYLSNRSGTGKEEPEESSQTQEVLLRDLSRNYPATPKEVVKYYSEILPHDSSLSRIQMVGAKEIN